MRHVCIHGHFYQPPRESPWLEEIEVQDSAFPYHDWNERISEECYAANAAARILDDDGLITKIVNNYARISFDFGPTLLAWLELARPDVYQAVLDADAQSRERFSGHGSALAQPYNHMIQPLANARDKRTQIAWGIRDFRQRFKRPPEGMWLPETAVDLESLDLMTEQDIRFTVLAPHQAGRVRRIGEPEWQPVGSYQPLDIGMPYQIRLSSGRSLAVFFYEGPVSRAVAFEGLLRSGTELVDRLLAPLRVAGIGPRLMHIATDGETYGHHHAHGDMALAFALETIDTGPVAQLTNYANFLERFPPTHEVEIVENTSWSCAHGIERWRSDCGCRIGHHEGWTQAWRRPLRDALDWLRDRLARRYEIAAAEYLKDPWKARDDYIDVVLDRSERTRARFLREHAAGPLEGEELTRALQLLELQRHAMLMYTSCGWFFDDLAGIETIQILQYADRAIQLAEQVGEFDLDRAFVERLREARSNRAEEGDGAAIYDRHIRTARVDLPQVGAHYAISSLFNGYGEDGEVFRYRVETLDHRKASSGRARLAMGNFRVVSEITREAEGQTFAVLHLGDQNLVAGIHEALEEVAYSAMADELSSVFEQGDFTGCIGVLERHLGSSPYSLRSLFRDQRREILASILEAALADVEASTRRLYERHAPLLGYLNAPDHPLARALTMAIELTLNSDLRRALDPDDLDLDTVEELFARASKLGVSLDRKWIPYQIEQAATVLAERLLEGHLDPASLAVLERLVKLARDCPLEVNLWKVQNLFYMLLQRVLPEAARRSSAPKSGERAETERLRSLGATLRVRVP